eukprot:3494356-Pyramimonas_sp.AAC.1
MPLAHKLVLSSAHYYHYYSPASAKVALKRLQLIPPCVLVISQPVPAAKFGGVPDKLKHLA